MDISPTILVVDDEPGVLQPLRAILQRAGYVVTAVDSGEAALGQITQQRFDLALIDLKLKGIGGIEVLAALREQSPDTVAIILTAHATLDTAVEALRRGAHDYIFKPCRTEELLESLRSGLLKRDAARAEGVTGRPTPPVPAAPATRGRWAGLEVDLDTHVATLDGRPLDLSPAEFNVLAHLVQEAPRVVPAQELVQRALGYSAEPWEARDLIRFHIHRLRAKIAAVAGHVDLIRTVRGIGYTLQQ